MGDPLIKQERDKVYVIYTLCFQLLKHLIQIKYPIILTIPHPISIHSLIHSSTKLINNGRQN